MQLSGELFYWFILVGLGAQLVDGALGMAFGLVSSAVLLSLGIPPAAVSAAVHSAEVFTTGASGLSHLVAGNVDKPLFLRLAGFGALGGITGAWLLTRLPADLVRPLVYLYLFALALLILLRAAGKLMPKGQVRRVGLLGFAAGLLDASGGGGWGPVVTSTMLAVGHDVKKTIGTVNTAEFLVTLAETTTFVVLIRDFTSYWQTILGLIIGGVCAAPLAAWICKKIPVRPLLAVVGILIIVLNLYSLLHYLAVF